MASARDLIRTNTGPQSGLVITSDYNESSFTPKGWTKSHLYSTQKIEVTAVNASNDAFGSTLEFRPAKNADYYGFVCLQIPFSAITRGSDDTFCRFVDYAGLFAIESIKVSHVSNLLTQIDGNLLYPQYIKNSDPRKRHHYDPLVLGNLSPMVRHTLARSPQVALVPLDGLFWFTYSTSCFIPVIVLSHELRFEVTFRYPSAIIQSDYAANGGLNPPACSISAQTIKGITYNPALVFLASHVSGDERAFQTSIYEADGLMAPFKEFKAQPRVTLTSGQSGKIPIRLTSLKDQVSEIWFVIRRATDVSTQWLNRPSRTLSYVAVSFTGNGGEMIPTHTKEYIDRRIREQFYSSWQSQYVNIGVLPLAWVPEDPVNCTGTIHLGVISDPILNIDVGTSAGQSEAYDVLNGTGEDSTGAENIVVDVFTSAFNWLHFVGGDVNKTFQ